MGDTPPDALSPDDILKGRALEACMQHFVHQGIVKVGRPPLKGTLRVGSLCSGSEMLSVALDALTQECKKQGIDLSFKVVMVCEIDPKKRFHS
jgi:hypothetical protein